MTLDDVLALVRDIHGATFVVEARATHGQSDTGAWFAVDGDGRRVVLKWEPDEARGERFRASAACVDALARRGYPVPRHGPVLTVPGAVLAVQEAIDGEPGAVTAAIAERLVECNLLQAGALAPALPVSWGAFMVDTLLVGEDGWCIHAPLRRWDSRTPALLDRARAVGAEIDPAAFPDGDVVHLDFHPGNVLQRDGAVVAVIDWEGACRGDRWFDLVSLAHDAEAVGDPTVAAWLWELVEPNVAPDILRAYLAHLVIRLVDWQIRHDPDDVEPWIVSGERLFARYEV